MNIHHHASNKNYSTNKSTIITTELISLFSAQMLFFIIPIIAITTLDATNSQVGIINTFAGLGVLVFLALLSPLADTSRKDRILGLISLIRGIISATATYALLTDSLNFFYLCILVFFISGLTALYDSAFSAALPEIIKKKELSKINNWIAGLRAAADIGAGSLAGLSLAFGGAAVTLSTITVLYILSSLGSFSLKNLFDKENTAPSETISLNTVFLGFKILYTNPVQLRLNLGIAHFNIFTTLIQTLYIAYMIRHAHMNEVQIGIASSIGGALGLAGVFIAAPLIEKLSFKTLMSTTLLVPGLAAFGIFLIPDFPPVTATLALGVSLGFWIASTLINISAFETLKQLTIQPHHIGKYTSASRLLTWGLDPVGAALAAAAALIMPLDLIMLIGSIGIATSSLWIIASKQMTTISITITDTKNRRR